MAFLGASYFRFLGRGQRYGLSARGLAIGGGRRLNEEFPYFREFWIETPDPNAETITIYALLDGESATGAFRFDLVPGQDTYLETSVTLFARKTIPTVGLAPLSSMFFVGKNDRRFSDDFRSELHDSDGLLMHTGAGEWIWRPLSNPLAPSVSAFMDRDPRGFGLLQRDRNFSDYQDLDLAYELRPSYWIEPRDNWGEGKVELLELPTGDETNDNIVVAWAPKDAIEAGKSLSYAYRITALTMDQALSPGGRTVATFRVCRAGARIARIAAPGRNPVPDRLRRGRPLLLHERPLAGGGDRQRLERPDPAHLPHPQRPHARLPRRGGRGGRFGPEHRPQGLPALGLQGSDRDLDLPLAGVNLATGPGLAPLIGRALRDQRLAHRLSGGSIAPPPGAGERERL